MFPKILFLSIIGLGACLRISQEISNYKFSKRNSKRLKRRQKLKALQERDWVDELLDEIIFKIKIKS